MTKKMFEISEDQLNDLDESGRWIYVVRPLEDALKDELKKERVRTVSDIRRAILKECGYLDENGNVKGRHYDPTDDHIPTLGVDTLGYILSDVIDDSGSGIPRCTRLIHDTNGILISYGGAGKPCGSCPDRKPCFEKYWAYTERPHKVGERVIDPVCPWCKKDLGKEIPLLWNQFKETWYCPTHGEFDESQIKDGV